MTIDVYGVGNSLVDIQARVSDEVVTQVGYHKGVMTLVDEAAQHRVLRALDGAPLSRCAGGSAANTVIALADFGGKAAYAGKVAGDPLGRFFLQDMHAKIGVAIDVPVAEETPGPA